MKTNAAARWARRLFAAIALCLAPAAAAAQEAGVPVPKYVIYPGQPIRDDMLVDAAADEVRDGIGPYVESRSQLYGKSTRMTLLPGRAIPLRALANRRLVVNGAEVKLVYAEGGLVIVTSGMALQDGTGGDTIKVRNSDSGIIVSGSVQDDGSVRVSGG